MPGLPLAFAVPAVLAALALLPALWLLLRVTPPRPSEIPFPPLRLLLDLRPRDETPARTPLWLLLLRMAIAAAVILAMAGPIWNPPPAGAARHGPLLLLVDDGWPAAPDWDSRRAFLERQADAAMRAGRSVVLAPLSAGAAELRSLDAADRLGRLRALQPQPWIPDRMRALPAIRAYLARRSDADAVWLTDGLEQGGAHAFASALAAAAPGRLRIFTGGAPAIGVAGVDNGPSGLQVGVRRAGPAAPSLGVLRALDRKGLEIGRASFDFKGRDETTARFDLPIELRNQAARVDVAGERSAGGVALIDFRSRRRTVAVVSGDSADLAQPYVAPDYFLDRALTPFAEIRDARRGEVDPIVDLVTDDPAMLVLADIGRIPEPARGKLADWIEKGGVLVRFAGTRMSESVDDLVPVRLRQGGRVLGGALSWDTPKRLAPFDRSSPFFGLNAPAEVTVRRQVLAEPDADLPSKIWASLADGTPLVTAAHRGKGLVVLFHVTADTSWSNLPLSGLFVDMLRRIVDLSNTTASRPDGTGARAGAAAPSELLNGFGELGPPPDSARPIPPAFAGPADREHPPGFYGPPEASVAVNALRPADRLSAANFSGVAAPSSGIGFGGSLNLRPDLILVAFVLFLVDAVASVLLARGLRLRPRRAVAAAIVVGLATSLVAGFPGGGIGSARAAESPPAAPSVSPKDVQAALKTSLAYVLTGNPEVDAESKAGLSSLTDALNARTSFAPGPPAAIDPARDELVFYPMIYWPIVAGQPQPSALAVRKIAAFMKEGGTIVFDTRDALETRPGEPPTPEAQWLRTLLTGVDVPELEPTPPDHVITKTFYLLDDFVGRTTVGQTWIQALPPPAPGEEASRPARAGDGVSPIIITSNDLAAAWASTPDGEPLYPLIPGGDRQHEMALRGGINIAMYTLTGNYKADQVHVRDLLGRLAR